MLCHRRRRWHSIDPALGKYFVFTQFLKYEAESKEKWTLLGLGPHVRALRLANSNED